MPARQPRPRFEIWQVAGRIHSEENPVRLEILRLLETGPRSLKSLVQSTRKAKSTLSAIHIPSLANAGLIEEVPDPDDARVKRYRLAGRRLGRSDVDVPQLRDAVLSFARSAGAIPLPPILQIVDPATLVASGARAGYVDGVARRIGEALGHTLTEPKIEAAAKELGGIVRAAGLGELEWTGDRARVVAKRKGLQEFLERVVGAALAGRVGPSGARRD